MKKRRRIKIYLTAVILLVVMLSMIVVIPSYFAENLYPLNYRAAIKKNAKQFKLDPNFVAAVIFTESRFNPRATSGVGARGLMQLMPSTAKGLASGVGDKNYSPNKLYIPEYNIKYGSYYLRGLMKQYKGNKDYVLMHYNGGGGAVMRYKRNGGLPRETRGFVRKVKATEKLYDDVYGEWWTQAEFKKPTRAMGISGTNIQQFWRVLISTGGNQ